MEKIIIARSRCVIFCWFGILRIFFVVHNSDSMHLAWRTVAHNGKWLLKIRAVIINIRKLSILYTIAIITGISSFLLQEFLTALVGFLFFLSIGATIIDTLKHICPIGKALGAVSIVTSAVFLGEAVFCAKSSFKISTNPNGNSQSVAMQPRNWWCSSLMYI